MCYDLYMILSWLASTDYSGALINPLLAPETLLNRLNCSTWRNLLLEIILLLGCYLQLLLLNMTSFYHLPSHFYLNLKIINLLLFEHAFCRFLFLFWGNDNTWNLKIGSFKIYTWGIVFDLNSKKFINMFFHNHLIYNLPNLNH